MAGITVIGGGVNIPSGTSYFGSDGKMHTTGESTSSGSKSSQPAITTGPGSGVNIPSGTPYYGSDGKMHAYGETTGSGLSGSYSKPSTTTGGGYDPSAYYDQYKNPFGNDAAVAAVNDYAKSLEKTLTDYAKSLYGGAGSQYNQIVSAANDLIRNIPAYDGSMSVDAYTKQVSDMVNGLINSVGSATSSVTSGKAQADRQIADALQQLKDTVNGLAGQVISGAGSVTLPDGTAIGGSGGGTTGGTTGGESSGDEIEDGGIGDVGDVGGSTTSPAPFTIPEVSGPNPERVEHVDTQALKDMLQQIVDSQTEQSNKTIDYNVERGINELTRALEDAAKSYQTQRNQVAADEAKALDNQALYSEARGDRGGIGAAEYDAIQNTAAQNRRAVNDAQVKLGTDTARQIADLRAQGEFEKADQLLSIAQSHMSQLMNLEQWAMSTNLGVDEFNSQLQQWVDEYNLDKQKFLSDLELSAAQLTGVFSNGSRTLDAEKMLRDSLTSSGNALLNMGIMPSRQQLQAMGMTEKQAKEYVAKKTSPLGVLGLI